MTNGFIVEGFNGGQQLFLSYIKANSTFTWQDDKLRALKFREFSNASELLGNLGTMNSRFVQRARVAPHTFKEKGK